MLHGCTYLYVLFTVGVEGGEYLMWIGRKNVHTIWITTKEYTLHLIFLDWLINMRGLFVMGYNINTNLCLTSVTLPDPWPLCEWEVFTWSLFMAYVRTHSKVYNKVYTPVINIVNIRSLNCWTLIGNGRPMDKNVRCKFKIQLIFWLLHRRCWYRT